MIGVISRLINWDFIRMGKGIESRYARCAQFWEPHLRCTKAFVERHIIPGGRIAVLGAGRLFDIDLPQLLAKFSEIHLFDADPSVIGSWRRVAGPAFRKKVIPRIGDVTGSLSEWSAGLGPAIRRGSLARYLDSLQPGSGGWESERFDGVISLNVVGQLPIYWRDRVLDRADAIGLEENRALVDSMTRLQSAHVAAVRERPMRWSIVITDTEYYTYTVDRSEWHVESALHGTVEGELLRDTPHMRRCGEDRWLWHLAPQFIESDTEGYIHRVEASAWRARVSGVGQRNYRW